MEGGKPASESNKSNMVVIENETLEAVLLAYKMNLLVFLGSLTRPIYTLLFAVIAWIAPACMPYSAYGTMPVLHCNHLSLRNIVSYYFTLL
jgi:hypothetical protein